MVSTFSFLGEIFLIWDEVFFNPYYKPIFTSPVQIKIALLN